MEKTVAKNQSAGQERKLYLDVLRILAVFLVCYNHSYGFHLYLEQVPDGSLLSWRLVAASVLTTINIPLFFMLSGALLLGKKESYRELFRKRIRKFLVLLFSASIGVSLLTDGFSVSPAEFFRKFLSGEIYITYWYLYAYLSLLLAKPLLQKIAEQLTGRDIVFLLALRVVFFSGTMLWNGFSAVFGMTPVILAGEFRLPFTTLDILFYPLMGYYLTAKLPMEKMGIREILGCVAVILLGTGITAVLVYAEGYFLGFTQNYTTLFSYSSAMAVLILVRYGMEKVTVPAWLGRCITGISSVAIGIYLLEPILDRYLYEPFHRGMEWTVSAIQTRSLLWCIACMVLCGGMTWILRKIPGVRKYL